MKTIIKKSAVLILLVILFSNISIAQQEKINPGERQSQLSYEIPPEKSIVPQREISAEEKKLTEQLMQAKQTGSADEMMRIQKELDTYAGSVTMQGIPAGKTERIYGSLPPGQTITATKIINGHSVRAIALQKEQIGSSNRMWAVIALAHYPTDTIYTLFSDDEGNNWNYYSRSSFSGAYVNSDEIDAEIVQTSTEKFIFVVCGIIFYNGGKRLIGQIIIRPGIGYGIQYLLWPGEDLGNNVVGKYRPRITSDCAQYQYSNAWIYIACCQDSVVSGGYKTCVKTARINNPYTASPFVTYKSEPFFWNDFITNPDSHSDLAYYKDGSNQSIMVLQSNVPVNTNLYLTKSTIYNFTSFASFAGALDGGTALQKKHGYISSNGYYPNLMITDMEIFSSSDYDIQFFKSTDGGSSWIDGYVDYTGNPSYRADIMERKNVPGEFYLAYADFPDGFNNVHFCKATGNVWGAVVPQMNHLDAAVVNIRPCFTTTGGDNCFAIWTEANYTNVWVSSGCSGTITPNRNLQLNLFIQGRYRPAYDYMIGDTLQVLLRNTTSPYTVVGSAKSFQNPNGVGSYNFPAAVNGVNYYIVIKNRNSIETWSKSPGQSFSNSLLNYNFYTWAQAYGGNLVEVDDAPYRFGIYTGDVNQDGVIEATDLVLIDNAAFNFVSGYVLTDLTGNSFVDGSDYLIADNNAFNFVSVARP